MSDYNFSYVPPVVARQAERQAAEAQAAEAQAAGPAQITKPLPAPIEAPIWGPSFSDVKAWFQKILPSGSKVLPPSQASGGFSVRAKTPAEKP